MKKLNWKTKDGKYINMLNKKQFTDEHLKNAYFRACLMYLRLHVEYTKDVFTRTNIYKKLFHVLRDLETVAIIRRIDLNYPDIPLIDNDRLAYWKDKKVIIYVS
jgi:hypothetical protein